MPAAFTEHDLEAYLDEELEPQAMAAIEEALRDDRKLARALTSIHGRRDAGVHSLGAIWRRHRVSCPTREQLGSYLLGVLDREQADYLKFHVETVGCRLCAANLADLRRRQEESAELITVRRKKYFDSSAGYLKK